MWLLYYILILIGTLLFLLVPYGITVRLIIGDLPTYSPQIYELGIFYGIIIIVSGIFFWGARSVKKNIKHRRQMKEFESFLSEKD
jgi:hypothetical protein